MAIIVKDAVKKYGQGESGIYALNHAGLEIEGGEICVILGRRVPERVLCLICWEDWISWIPVR